MLQTNISEVTARRARLGIVSARPIVRAYIPKGPPPKKVVRIGRPPLSEEERAQRELEHVRSLVSKRQAKADARRATLESIWRPVLEEALQRYGVTEEAIRQDGRSAPVIEARRELFYRMTVEMGISLSTTGKLFNKDRATVRHYRDSYTKRLEAAKQ